MRRTRAKIIHKIAKREWETFDESITKFLNFKNFYRKHKKQWINK